MQRRAETSDRVPPPAPQSWLLEPVGEGGEGGVGEGGFVVAAGSGVYATLFLNASGMLVVVAVDAQQFPVAAVGRIVVVVEVSVVYCQLTKFFSFKLAGAAAADVGEKL